MRVALAFLLVLASIGSYFYLALRKGVYQRVPLAHLVGAAAGVLLLAKLAWSARSGARVALAFVAALFAGGFAYYALWFSVYPNTIPKLRPGERLEAPDVVLRDASGAPFVFEKEIRRAPATIVVFYRGFW
jgi:cytochrome bd-type quinol oxidase subunit 2